MTQLWNRMPLDAIVDAASQVTEEVVYGIGRAITDFWSPAEAVAFLRLIIWEGPRFPELGHGLMDCGRSPARRAVNGYVRRLGQDRGFRIDDPDLATTQLIDVILGEMLAQRGLPHRLHTRSTCMVVYCSTCPGPMSVQLAVGDGGCGPVTERPCRTALTVQSSIDPLPTRLTITR
ncbi:regulatory protein TetR [Mycolicibacterium canariasense]|uniref:Regulatory protein TetR n=3 Tax=Mycolicibacterium canariasense TaxID=228230 RepID=A0A100WCH6_MYCCR|nr:hypothetical protein AWB94_22025 [Mycolicibacterium canariasense]GAS95962.1 regulatory protein TetR [Mycolicibacterium canariasense]